MKKVHYKLLFLGVITILGILFSIPSVTSRLPGSWRTFLPGEGMRLGLDLQGGMHLILKVDLPKALQNQLEMAASDLRDILAKRKIPMDHITYPAPNRLRFRLPGEEDQTALKEILSKEFPNLNLVSASPTGTGPAIELALKTAEVRGIEENLVTQSLEIIRNRIDQFGVSEPLYCETGQR